jgi:hypothetical protein
MLFLEQWQARRRALYGDNAEPSATLTVTILAATGLSTPEPTWVAACAGEAAETGRATALESSSAIIPRGAPSWASEPLTLPVHDVSADLLLLLRDASAGGDDAKRCVGRAVLPLTELLPALPAFGAPPAESHIWLDIFPPSSAYAAAAGEVDAALTAPIPGVPGVGQSPPADGRQGAVLVRVALTLEASLIGAYCAAPPFDWPGGGGGGDGGTPLHPERVLVAASRLSSATSTPSLFVALATRPWSSGLMIVGLTGWLCFFASAPSLPWWLLTAWTFNAFAGRATELPPTPWEGPQSSQPTTGARSLEVAIAPLVRLAEDAAARLERASAAPSFADSRATLLLALPLLLLTALASLAMRAACAVAALVGGWPSLAFGSVCVAVIINGATYHRQEIYLWLGASGRALPDGDEEDEEAAGSPNGKHRDSNKQQQLIASSVRQSHERDGSGDDLGGAGGSHPNDVIDGCWSRLWTIVTNVALRMPDEPTRISRAIAHASMRYVLVADGDAPAH